MVVSSLAFHQVKYSYKTTALKNVKNLLNKNGRFVLCDTMILFDAENEPEFFDMVYRYLLEKTTPAEIYKNHIAPYLQKDYIYTWDDMKRYTPKDNWFYSLAELKEWLAECSLMVVTRKIPCSRALHIKYIGEYSGLKLAYRALFDYANKNDLIYHAPIIEIYQKGYGTTMAGNPARYETDIYLPLR